MCGIVGIWGSTSSPAARRAYFALHALQHRGQEAAGICARDDLGALRLHRDVGLVSSVFHENDLDGLPGGAAIGHVRYSTTGSNQRCNAQPMVPTGNATNIAVAHNGNLVNTEALRAELSGRGASFDTSTDSEVIAQLAARDGVEAAARRAEGGFSVVALTADALYAWRDPAGIRPLVLGQLDDGGWIVASETCALDLLGALYLRDLVPGELIAIDDDGLRTRQLTPPRHRHCSFEAIYFSRPDSKLGSETVHDIRIRLGLQLAYEAPAPGCDAVIAVPDSAHAIALGYSARSGLPYRDGLIKNRYVARTFIEPTQAEREMAMRKKFNPLSSAVVGRRLVVVDDSLVRGTTMTYIVARLREAGATEVHLRIGSPPALHPCHYGVDMGHEGDYAAEGRTPEEVAELVGADSLAYLSLDGLARALKRPLQSRCTACFSGDYPVSAPVALVDQLRFESQA